MPSKIINACKNGKQLHKINNIPDIPDIWGRFPIYYAVRYKSCEAVELLLKSGSNIYALNTISGHKVDLLYTALKTRDIPIIQCILDHWRTTVPDLEDYLPYIFDSKIRITAMFIRHFNVVSLKGHESIICKYAKTQHYQWLKEHNVCFDIQQALKYTIIYRRTSCFSNLLASHAKHKEQINYIYQTGAKSNFTLLSLCGLYGYLKGIRELIAKGADLNIITVNNRGETMNNIMTLVNNDLYNSLSVSYRSAIKSCLKYLVLHNSVNWQNSRGQTALMMAYRAGNMDLVDILLCSNADPDVVDMDGNVANYYK